MILFINACVRTNSRTMRLARRLLTKLNRPFEELRLADCQIPAQDEEYLRKRDRLIDERAFGDPMFAWARQFSLADEMVIAAPYWDLSFPAILKQYLELINVMGITFRYTAEGTPEPLCRAKKLYYVTTAGGALVPEEYGFGYVKALAEDFYGIPEVRLIQAAGLDIDGADVEGILRACEEEIDGIGREQSPIQEQDPARQEQNPGNVAIDISNVILKTDRLILRPWRMDDLKDFNEYASVDGVGQMAGWKPHESMEESQKILTKFIEQKKTFALEYQGRVIGSLGIEYHEKRVPEHEGKRYREIGFVLAKPYWGQGLMPEAVKEVIRYLFEEVGLDVLFCGHFLWNDRSRRVQEKCGFRHYSFGTFETKFGTVEDEEMRILTKEEWLAGRP